MTGIVINVDVRERTGTGGARATRRNGQVPGILYGGPRGPVAIAASQKDLLKAIRSGKFMAHMVDLRYGDEVQPVIPRDVQWDPVSDLPVHFDLYRVEDDAVISVDVPVKFINQEACPALKRGGVLNIVRHTVELQVQAGNIPEELVIDLTGLDLGHVVHISSVRMPDGARPAIRDRDFTVATLAGRGGKPEDEAAA